MVANMSLRAASSDGERWCFQAAQSTSKPSTKTTRAAGQLRVNAPVMPNAGSTDTKSIHRVYTMLTCVAVRSFLRVGSK